VTRDLTRETSVALAAAREAGAMALSLQGGVSTRLKDDGSPVSDADLAADAILRAHLTSQFPEDAILSEEAVDDPHRLQASRLWIIDPIDGTSDYLKGRPDWAVQIALAIDGRLVLGVVAVPGEDVVLVGLPGVGGTILTGATASGLTAQHGARDTLITSSSARNRDSLAKVRAALPEFSALYATSVGIKVWRMLQGQADLYVHPRMIAEWDVAAPAAVLLAAGGHASDLEGREFRFNSPSARCGGLVFSVRDDHELLITRLRAGTVGLP
jgi:3'-phosphoadenosine 5'-phosphosulfate (PAPS) 3'-phosphatase